MFLIFRNCLRVLIPNKLKRFAKVENHGQCGQMVAEDPLHPGEEFILPPQFFHLQKYLEHYKWAVHKYAALDIKVTLIERRVCSQIDRVPTVEREFPAWSRLDSTNMIPEVLIPTNSIFGTEVSTVQAAVDLYKDLKFPLGRDHFQPFEGMTLRIMQQVPEVLTGKLSMDVFFNSLKTERAFMGQVYTPVESIRTPEAYKEILKITDIKGITQRLMIKSTLVLLAQLEALDPADTDTNELMMDWCVNFKEKLVMLFVNTFLLSVETDFLDGSIFQQSLRISSEEAWTDFATRIKTSMMQLRNNRDPKQYLAQLQSLIETVKLKCPRWTGGLNKVLKVLKYQFDSPKPYNQCLEQLAQVVSTLTLFLSYSNQANK